MSSSYVGERDFRALQFVRLDCTYGDLVSGEATSGRKGAKGLILFEC